MTEESTPERERMTTEDLERELEARRAKRNRGKHVKKHGVSVGALLVAAFGAYEGYANKEVATIAATVAAEAKVDSRADREDLVEAINHLKEENASLKATVVALEKLDQERYDQLRSWLRAVSKRAGGHREPPEPVASEIVIEEDSEPDPPMPKLSKERPKRRGDYMQQVQQVLEEKGLKR